MLALARAPLMATAAPPGVRPLAGAGFLVRPSCPLASADASCVQAPRGEQRWRLSRHHTSSNANHTRGSTSEARCGLMGSVGAVAKPRGQAAWRAGRRCPGSAAKAKHILRSRHAKRTPPRPQSSSTASKATPFRVQACGGVSSPQRSGTLNSTRARAASEKTGHTKRLPRGRHRTRPDHTAS